MGFFMKGLFGGAALGGAYGAYQSLGTGAGVQGTLQNMGRGALAGGMIGGVGGAFANPMMRAGRTLGAKAKKIASNRPLVSAKQAVAKVKSPRPVMNDWYNPMKPRQQMHPIGGLSGKAGPPPRYPGARKQNRYVIPGTMPTGWTPRPTPSGVGSWVKGGQGWAQDFIKSRLYG